MRNFTLAACLGLGVLAAAATEPQEPTVIDNQVPRLGGHQFCQTKGDVHFLVVLTEFSDVKYSRTYLPLKEDGTRETLQEFYTRYFNEPGFVNPYDAAGGENHPGSPKRGKVCGSVRDYWLENSNGQFRPVFDVYGVYKIGSQATYGGNGGGDMDQLSGVSALARAGFNAVKDKVDMSLYDHDGDGILDNIITVFSGMPENRGGGANAPWTLHVKLTEPDPDCQADGVMLQQGVNISVEQKVRDPLGDFYGERVVYPAGYGHINHEFAHALGIQDMYKTQGVDVDYTPGQWMLMDQGLQNNVSYTPSAMSCVERYMMDWLRPYELQPDQMGELDPLLLSNDAYIVPVPSSESAYPEFYLIENRQYISWDQFQLDKGMLVYHMEIDPDRFASNNINGVKAHQCIDLVEADGTAGDTNRKGDAYPGANGVTEFTDFSTWQGRKLAYALSAISDANDGDVVTFLVNGQSKRAEIPEPAETTAVDGSGFTAHWSATGADEYLVSVYTKGHDEQIPYFVDSWQKRRVGAATEVNVAGLEPDTQYYYRVKAVKDGIQSRYSAEMPVKTLDRSTVMTINAAAQPVVTAMKGRLLVEGADACAYDLSGRLAARLAQGRAVSLPAGVYVVRAGKTVVKVKL